MINKKASVSFTDKSHLIMDHLVNEYNKSVSSIINDLIENIDINIYRPDHNNASVFVVQVGRTKYVHKLLLDKWLLGQVIRQ